MTDTDTLPSFADKPTLVGDRVLLRPIDVADLPGVVELLNDAETMRLTGTHGGGAFTDEVLRNHLAAQATRTDRAYFAAVERATGEFVGEVVLQDLNQDNQSCGFRIALNAAKAAGRGLGTEATRLALGHAFDTVGLHRVELEVYDFNPRALRVYEKVGFVLEGTKRHALRWAGEWVDAHFMAMLDTDWAAANGRG
jgi:RimJ/RimL family protein N-acetyltransferase